METKSLAEYIAVKAVRDGFPSTKQQQKVLNAHFPKASSSHQRKKRRGKDTKLPSSNPLAITSGSRGEAAAAAAPSESGALVPRTLTSSTSTDIVPFSRTRRLVSYDVLDCTFGSGFHSGVILENGKPYSRIVAMDCDLAATESAREMVTEFGPERFRFYPRPMSSAKAMFGERSFDAIIIDPGPSITQLDDPERGFLLDDENDHCLDMRYGPHQGLGALEYLNSVPQHTLSKALASYELLTPEQSMKLAREIRRGRPFRASRQVLAAVEAAGNELPEGGWFAQDSRRKAPMSWKFLISLRCIVNNERNELQNALQNALLMLRDDGRLVVFSSLMWEENLISETFHRHPHALLCYDEKISIDDVQEYGHSRHTKMWVGCRTKQSSYILKNAHTLTDADVRESSFRWMGGLYAGQIYGFPANNFTFENMDEKDWKAIRSNEKPPPFDWGDEDRR